MLLDSNIIIYAYKAEFQNVRDFININDICVSTISYLETIGYHRISDEEKTYLQDFFDLTPQLPITHSIIQKATELRQQKNMSLGDVLIAATAIINNKTLVTRNLKDFEWISQLKILDPLSQ